MLRGRLARRDQKENTFLKNEAGKSLKTKDEPKKRTGNEAVTKLKKSLKTNNGPE